MTELVSDGPGAGAPPPEALTAVRAAPLSVHRLEERFATLDEIHDAAKASMDPAVWDFLEGGAGEELTLADNRRAFARWRFRPTVMNGIGVPDLSTTFLGIPLAMPVLTSPFGAEGQFHPDGHVAVARANAAAGIASIVPEASTYSLETIAAEAPAAARIMQLHPMGDEDNVLAIIERAAAAGYEALCFTCDCPSAGWRERNMRNRFDMDLVAVSGNYPPGSPVALEDVFGQLFERTEPIWSWDKLAEVCRRGGLPWMAKGIITGPDALAAAGAGASAVLVSNHGGRQLEGAPASLDQLPEIAEALAGSGVEIALDSGIRRGTDVLTALALGADVVVVGRAAALGLAADGQAGVERVHALLRQELATTMTLTGRASIDAVGPDLLQPARA